MAMRGWRNRGSSWMEASVPLLALLMATGGCSTQPEHATPPFVVAPPPRLDSYFERYCDYSGGLGIGLVASHTYDYRFRQRLKETRDPELKRLFVLQNLHAEVQLALDDFEKDIVRTGKQSSRPLSLAEWQDARKSIQTQIDDLAAYSAFTNFATTNWNPLYPRNPGLDTTWINDLRERLRKVTNAPAASQARQPASSTR